MPTTPTVSEDKPGPAASPTRSRGGWPKILLVVAVAVLAVGLIWRGVGDLVPLSANPSPSSGISDPAVSLTPLETATPAPPSGKASDLEQAMGDWTVDPKDPLYSRSDSNALVLQRDGLQLIGVGPENARLRLWNEGSGIVGEATDVGGKTWRMRWQWLEPGSRARLVVSDGTDSREVTLIRPSAASASAPAAPSPAPVAEALLFEVKGDLNSDGAPETARVKALTPGALASSSVDKQLEILADDKRVLFTSEVFQEPFRTDLDDMAEAPDQKAGLHIVKSGGGYPLIRVIFVCRSGNFVDFQFNGQTYVLAGQGD